MKVQVNPNRIKLIEFYECPLIVPKFTKKSLEGGFENGLLKSPKKRNRDPATRTSVPQDIFLHVDENGIPYSSAKSDKSLPVSAFYAKKPSLAAIKAYYSLIRRNSFPTQLMGGGTDFQQIEHEALKHSSKEDVDKYMEKVKISRAEPESVIYLRRPDSNKVMKYTVSYERVLKPNKHEVQKGITKVAHATKHSLNLN
jgi:hypothetical protein